MECRAFSTLMECRTAALPFNLQLVPTIKDDHKEIYKAPAEKPKGHLSDPVGINHGLILFFCIGDLLIRCLQLFTSLVK